MNYFRNMNYFKLPIININQPSVPVANNNKQITNKIGIGKIYSDSCGYSIALKPIWKRMKELIGNNTNIEYIELEASSSDYSSRKEQIEKKFGLKQPISVSGYPTIFRIKNGVINYFDKERTAEILKDFFIDKKNGNIKRRPTYKRRNNNRYGKMRIDNLKKRNTHKFINKRLKKK